jgi:phosphohistidine phosphatase
MKMIFLLRHAKSEWANENLSDIERPLNSRGYRDANEMSSRMKERKIVPELIVSSSAIRTTSTSLIFARNLDYPAGKIVLREDLYESNVKHYLDVIHGFDDKKNIIMLTGHNPTITDTANALTKAAQYEFPTCALLCLKAEVSSWKDFKNCTEVYYDYPKNES